MKTKTKLSLLLWAAAALFLSFWAVELGMTGELNGNSKSLTFTLAFCASIASAVCGAGFMQQWIIAKK
jgi:hypothetical protein